MVAFQGEEESYSHSVVVEDYDDYHHPLRNYHDLDHDDFGIGVLKKRMKRMRKKKKVEGVLRLLQIHKKKLLENSQQGYLHSIYNLYMLHLQFIFMIYNLSR